MIVLHICVLSVVSCMVSCVTRDNVNALMQNLFTTQGYNAKIRPISDQGQPIQLDVSLSLFSITSVDEVNEKLVTTGFLHLLWVDEYLTWTPSNYNETIIIFLPQNDIWKPDLVLKNGFKKFEELGGSFYYLQVSSGGLVTWMPYQVFETRCSIDITYFPFDKQSCDIKFVAWSHTVAEIEIQKSTGGIQFYEYEESSVWKVISTSSSIKKVSHESEITFTINLKRKPLYYIMNIVIPIVFLGILNVLVFVIPADAGEKMSYSVTVFLAFAVFLTIISTQLPANSENTSILGVYLIIQLSFGILVLITSSIQLRLRHRSEKEALSSFFLKIVILGRRFRCKTNCKATVSINPMSTDKKEHIDEKSMTQETDNKIPEYDWNDVSSAIDFFAFWILLFSNILITMVMFIYAASK